MSPAIYGRSKPTKARVAFAQKFNAGCSEIAITKFGATKIEDPIREICLNMDTRYGAMRIWPATEPDSVLDNRDRISFFTVFCRFETDDLTVLRAAAKHLNSNPYSGKYNFHYDGASMLVALRAFEQHLAAVRVV